MPEWISVKDRLPAFRNWRLSGAERMERRDLYRAVCIVQYYIHFVGYGILQAWLCNPIHRALYNKPGWPYDTGIHQGGHAMSICISPILGIVYLLLAASVGACVGLFFAACFRSGRR